MCVNPAETTSSTGPYHFNEGLRRIAPYDFTYKTYCKERWRNRPLLEIFSEEFRDRPKTYYVRGRDRVTAWLTGQQKEAIESGAIKINNTLVTEIDHIVRNGDIISHTMHRHEPPVTGEPIGIIHESEDLMVINKPAGVPVHPAGRYNHNSLIEIIRWERNHTFNPMPCHRLDRLTSGIMFIAKHRDAAEKLQRQIMDRTVKKEYIARVKGRFPDQITCDRPILVISPKLGLNRVRANGKDAKTIFKRLRYDPAGDYSIVQCLPITGRTHQLRVHLQFLGHPIQNDPIYSNRRVFGANLGNADSGSEEDDSIIDRLARMGREEVAEAVAYHDEMVEDHNRRKAERMTGEKCQVCGTELFSDPGQHELGIYLHAKRYAHADGLWSFDAPMPAWVGDTSITVQPLATVDDMDNEKIGDANASAE